MSAAPCFRRISHLSVNCSPTTRMLVHGGSDTSMACLSPFPIYQQPFCLLVSPLSKDILSHLGRKRNHLNRPPVWPSLRKLKQPNWRCVLTLTAYWRWRRSDADGVLTLTATVAAVDHMSYPVKKHNPVNKHICLTSGIRRYPLASGQLRAS